MTAVELASGFVSLSANTKQLSKDVGEAFGASEVAAKVSGEKAGAAHGTAFMGVFGKYLPEELGRTFEGAHKTAEDAGKAAGEKFSGGLKLGLAGLAVGGVAALGVGAAFMKIGETFEDVNNKIIQKTGASGEALKSLEESAKNVGKTSTQGFEAAGDAITTLHLKLGLSGKPLEDLSTKFLNLARITHTEVAANIDVATGAFQKWHVAAQDQSGALDSLYAASTKTGVSVTDLAGGLKQFGAPLQTMGFNLQQSTALLGQLTKSGANTDQVMGTLRKGLATFAKEGVDPATAMDKLVKSIKDAPTPIAATAEAIKVFGARGGTEMSNAIRSGQLSVKDLMGEIAGSGTTINSAAERTQTFQQSWSKFKNELTGDVEPAASRFFEVITKSMSWITDNAVPVISKIAGMIGTDLKKAFEDGKVAVKAADDSFHSVINFLEDHKTIFSVIGGSITAVLMPAMILQTAQWVRMGIAAMVSGGQTLAIWAMLKISAIAASIQSVISFGIMAAGWVTSGLAATASGIAIAAAWVMALGPVAWIIAGIALVVGAFILLWTKCTWFRDFWKAVWNDILVALKWVWENAIKPVFDSFVDAFHDVEKAATWLWHNVLEPAWHGIGEAIGWVIDNIIKPAFQGFKDAMKDVENFFGDVVKGIKTAWDDVKKAVAVPINFIIQTVWNDGLLKAWNSVADWLPGLHKAAPMAPVAFDGGGATRGQRGVDNIPALLGGDEHVFDRFDVDALGGQNKVYALRHMLDTGQAFSWTPGTGVQAARTNGIQAFDKGGAPDPLWMTQLAAGHALAKSKDHHAYTWGFEDCSGYMSMIADKILGGPGDRRWATSSFPGGQPWVPGLGEGFSVGVHDDPGGPGGGHTSGTLSGVFNFPTVNVESGGSHGDVAYGGAAAGADDKQWDGVRPGRFHLAIGTDGAFVSAGGPSSGAQEGFLVGKLHKVLDDILNPIKARLPHPPPEMLGWPGMALQGTEDAAVRVAGDVIGGLGNLLGGAFHAAEGVGHAIGSVFRDTGGFIPNGLTLVRNETGKPEAVLNWQQLAQVKDMMASGKSLMDAVKQVGGDTNPADFNKATGAELNPASSPSEVGAASYSQKMTTVIADAGKTFTDKLPDIFSTALFEILTPSSTLPNPKDLAQRYTITPSTSTSGTTSTSTSSTTADVSSGTTQTTATTPGTVSATTVAPAALAPTDYVGNIAKAAKDAGLDINAATIATATAIVESNMKMYANSKVPESLRFPYDAVGSDGTSVGLFQQQQNGAWGTLADDMDAYKSAGLFYKALQNVTGWQSMDKGAAAQAVQRSAYPDKYGQQMAKAGSLLKDKFDTGGIVRQGLSIVDNQTGSYEHMGILTQDQWDNLSTLAQGGSHTTDNRTIYQKGAIVAADISGFHRAQKNLNIKQSMGNRGRPSQ